jgi:AmmeMemoRadiSam system protein B
MKTADIRAPAVAGLFYPSSAYELQSDVERFMVRRRGAQPSPRPKALIAPHAGYPYSGPVAGSAFTCVRDLHKEVTRVILIGPSHRMAFRGLALSAADAFHTPLGDIPVDHVGNALLTKYEFVKTIDRAHRDEHCLEVELPFLQCTLDQFSIVPMLAGDTTAHEVATVINELWGGPETLIVISSDLSHYLPYDRAKAMDQRASAAILTMKADELEPEMACGRLPIQGLLIAAKKHGLHAVQLDLRNSGDTAGDRSQVVGYGAWIFTT